MTRARTRCLGSVLCVLLLPAVAWAQGSSAASITGTVKDTSGAVLPGVTVEAASPALIEKVRTTVTDDKGEYRIIELRPGAYSVTFTLPGFSVFKRDGLELGIELHRDGERRTESRRARGDRDGLGETPLVDTQSVSQQQSISKTQLDAVPTGKGLYGFVALMPAAIVPTAQQDVGGNLGDSSVRISVHGARTNDMRQLVDGLSFNLANGDGNARGFYVNPLSSQEIIIDQAGSGGQAEYGVGGAIVNMISRDGGNTFSASLFSTGSTEKMQADNLTDALKAQGLTSSTKSIRIYDLNAFVGGPIRQDKLWFATSHRLSGQKGLVANLYQDANLNARVYGAPAAVWKFAPDFSKPVEPNEDNQAHNVRLTWQATPTNKVTFSYDWQWNRNQNNVGTLATGTVAWEGNPGANNRCTEENLLQATWIHPHTSKLLFEGGWNYLHHRQQTNAAGTPCANGANGILINDVGLNFTYNGSGVNTVEWQYPTNQRVSMSYVTGAHNFKTGLIAVEYLKPTFTSTDRGNIPFSYTLNNGTPTGLTQYVSPQILKTGMNLGAGIFAQDQWRMGRVTLNLGLRYDYVKSYAPALEEPGGTLYNPISFPEVNCLPCWHDISPRVGVVYDVFGNGRTAIKGSFGRYVSATQAGLVEAYRPAIAAVNSTTRAWTDSNGNFFPDCDLRNPALNNECGPMANQTFGGTQVRLTPDPKLDHRVGQPRLQLADGRQRPARAEAGRGGQRRLLPDDVGQFHGHRQPAGHARRLRSVLHHGAHRCAPGQRQRTTTVRVLRHLDSQVRPGEQHRHACRALWQGDRVLQRRRCQLHLSAAARRATGGRLEYREHDQPAQYRRLRVQSGEPMLRRGLAAGAVPCV